MSSSPAPYEAREQAFLLALLEAQPTPPPRGDVPVQLDIWGCIEQAEQDEEATG